MIKRTLLSALLLCLLLTACGTSSASLPVLKVDQAHMSTPGLDYQIPAGNGFILDASGYEFNIPANLGQVDVNYVEIAVYGKVYGAPWTAPGTDQAITVDKLQPLIGGSALGGFQSGQQLIVALGYKNGSRFAAVWSGVIDVK